MKTTPLAGDALALRYRVEMTAAEARTLGYRVPHGMDAVVLTLEIGHEGLRPLYAAALTNKGDRATALDGTLVVRRGARGKDAAAPGAPVRTESVYEIVDRFEEAICTSRLPSRARHIYLVMLRSSTPGKDCFDCDLSRTAIAKLTGLSPRSVRREQDVLTAEGWLVATGDGHELRVPEGGAT